MSVTTLETARDVLRRPTEHMRSEVVAAVRRMTTSGALCDVELVAGAHRFLTDDLGFGLEAEISDEDIGSDLDRPLTFALGFVCCLALVAAGYGMRLLTFPMGG